MHITILAHGSRGDVQPYVALGLGLKQAGHSIRIAAPELFRSLIVEYGLEFAPLAGDPKILMQNAVDQAGGRPNLLRVIPVVLKYATPLALQVIKDARQACQGTQAIIHSFLMTVVGHEIALQLGVPDFSALVFAVFSRISAFPNGSFPKLPLGSWYNRLTHELFTQVYWQGGRIAYNWIRRGKHDEYPALSEWPFAVSNRRVTPILYGFSPFVIPKALDWNEHTHATGFWLLPALASGPPELVHFLETGSPPVCISFGSVIERDAKWLTGLVLDALAQSGQRGVFVTGWGGLAQADLPENIFAIDSVPFDWLFPRVAAVVIHGGIGTTAAAMHAGIPAVVIPFTADQSFWAEQVYRLGAGSKPIPRQKLTVDNLTQAIRTVIDNPLMRQRASQLGQTLRLENGVLTAVKILEKYLI
jgi:sterol 3beta-glucosyltransferase